MTRILLLALTITFLTPFHCRGGFVENVTFEETKEALRIVFTISGELPKNISTKTTPVSISFDSLDVTKDVETKFFSLPALIEKIAVNKGKPGSMEIFIKDSKSLVEQMILPTIPPKPGSYRLVFDIIPSQTLETSLPQPSEQKPSQPPPQQSTESEPKESKAIAIPFREFIFLEAQRAEQNKNYERAVRLYKKYLSQSLPLENEKEAYIGLALSFYKLQEKLPSDSLLELIEILQQAIAANPNHSEVLYLKCLLGASYRKLGLAQKAQLLIEEILGKNPSKRDAFCAFKEMGLIHMNQQDYVEAIQSFNKALDNEYDPKESSEVRYLLSKLLSETKNYKPAMDHLKNTLDKDPTYYLKNPAILKILGDIHFGLGNYQASTKAYLWYLNTDPKAGEDDILWANIAESLMNENKTALAERLYDKIMVEMPDTEGAYLVMLRKAQILEGGDKLKQMKALTIYEDLSRRQLPEPLRFLNQFRWASLMKSQKRFEEALTVVDQTLPTIIDNQIYKESLVELKKDIIKDWLLEEYSAKNYEKVVEIFNNYQENLSTEDVLLPLSESFYNTKHYRLCFDFYEKLIRSQSLSQTHLFQAGYCAYMVKEFDKAQEIISKIPKPQPEHIVFFSKIYLSKKRCVEAVNTIEKVLENFLSENNKESLFSYLDCLIELKNYNKLVKVLDELFQKVTTLDQKDKFNLLRMKARCYEKMKDLERAISTSQEALELATSSDDKCELLYELYSLHLKRGKIKESEVYLKNLSECENVLWKKFGSQSIKYMELMGTLSQNP